MSKILNLTKESHVWHLTLSRPDKGNALNMELIRELTRVFLEADVDPNLRIVVLSGEGKHFCSGGDIEWMKQSMNLSAEENTKQISELYALFASIDQCSKATLGKIHGAAFGGGLGLVSCLDFSFCLESSKFSLSEARIGLMPATIVPYVSKKIGWARCRSLGIRANIFGAYDAKTWGLVTDVYDSESDQQHHIEECIEDILLCSPQSVKTYKGLVNHMIYHDEDHIKQHAIEGISKLRQSSEGQEGLKAFLEKRKPSWIKS
ncbi:MAG: enoyl-CoA hydratase-related protein [Bdellovibrionota bacterium]